MCICIRCVMYISISYFVFLVVVGVDDFPCFVIFHQPRLVVVCYWLCGLSMFLLRHVCKNFMLFNYFIF
jgi:hypothetical protein